MFSLARNKLHRLPAYLAQFRQLTVLKVDQNPLEWPPASLLAPGKETSDPQHLAEWVRQLQTWLEENVGASNERKRSDDSMSSEQGNDSLSL